MAQLNQVRRSFADERFVAIGLVLAIVAVVALRTLLFGWSPIAPDDARYLFVGLSVFGGDGPVTPAGAIYLLRSPVYGVALASGGTLLGGDPVVGAQLVAIAFATAGLLGAVWIGWRIAGPGGGVGTAVAIMATPLVWRLLPSLRIDLPQTAGVVVVLLTVWRPSLRRWALGGVLFGLTVLVKETVLPLALLPLALVGFEAPRRVATIWATYLVAAIATAAWWWVVVWLKLGLVFPSNAIGVIVARAVGTDLRPGVVGLALLGVFVASWLAMAARARADRGARLLIVGAACLGPAALYAESRGLDARNLAGLAVLSTIAVGVTGATSVAWVRRRIDTGATRIERLARGEIVGLALATLLVIGVAGAVAIAQRSAGRPAPAGIENELAAWLRANTARGGRISMTFRDRELMAIRLFDSVDVASLSPIRVRPTDDLADYLWLGLRDRQLFGYRRSAWERVLTQPPVSYLVLTGPHPFDPAELNGALVGGGVPGLSPVASLKHGSEHATILAVSPTAVRAAPGDVSLHLSAAAAVAWLDLVAPGEGEASAVGRLLAARPVVSGTGLTALVERLGDAACTGPLDDGVVLGPAGTCAA